MLCTVIIIIINNSWSSTTIETESTGFHLDVTLLGGSEGFNVFSRQQIIWMGTEHMLLYIILCILHMKYGQKKMEW